MRRSWAGWGLALVVGVGCGGQGALGPAGGPKTERRAESGPTLARQAEALTSEGDATLKVNVDEAIERYQQALGLVPDSVTALGRLGAAYERKEAWAEAAGTYGRLMVVEPLVPEHARRRGRALLRLAAEPAGPEREQAREPLERCLKLDPKDAECAFLLGTVEAWADEPRAAATHFLRAIELFPGDARFYRALAELYWVMKQPLAAEMVLTHGMRRVPKGEQQRADLAAMAARLSRYAYERGDLTAQLGWVQSAEELMDEADPVLLFEVARSYQDLAPGSVANREKALRLFQVFQKRVCKGSLASVHKAQCELSHYSVMRLGEPGDSLLNGKPSAPPFVPLPNELPVPKLELRALREGEAWTVFGASYYLRSARHRREVIEEPIAIVGYVSRTNLPDAPRCAVHRSGVADPENCRAEIPTFWLCDAPHDADRDCIRVMGFASNYAQLYEAIRQADSPRGNEPYNDEFWGQVIPNPLPVAGAKLVVRGRYGDAFAKASSGAVLDPVMGVLDFAERDVLEEGPTLSTLPGVKRRAR